MAVSVAVPSVTSLSLALPASRCATPSAQVPLYPILSLSFLQFLLSQPSTVWKNTSIFIHPPAASAKRERQSEQQNLQTTVSNKDTEKGIQDYCISLAYATDWHSNWHRLTALRNKCPDNGSLSVSRACADTISIYRHSFPHKD